MKPQSTDVFDMVPFSPVTPLVPARASNGCPPPPPTTLPPDISELTHLAAVLLMEVRVGGSKNRLTHVLCLQIKICSERSRLIRSPAGRLTSLQIFRQS